MKGTGVFGESGRPQSTTMLSYWDLAKDFSPISRDGPGQTFSAHVFPGLTLRLYVPAEPLEKSRHVLLIPSLDFPTVLD